MTSSKVKHVAIIMDGNRRYARKINKMPHHGHEAGFNTLLKFTENFLKSKIPVLTIFCFSSENWNRSQSEIDNIIKLIKKYLKKNIEDKIFRQNVKFSIIGNRNFHEFTNKKYDFKELNKKILELENETKMNKQLHLNIAFNYGGKDDIVHAANKIFAKNMKITIENIKENLWTAKLPPVDIMIRTGGDKRISNFLIWDLAYSELFFIKKTWPCFKINDFNNILTKYNLRERRFGK